jgi:hypothetical protein
MRLPRVFVGAAALALATAFAALPTQVASAQPPSTQVLVPSTGATVSGTQVVLDAIAPAGVTQVQFELTGGTLNDWVIATATPTIYGWIALWNSTEVPNGSYQIWVTCGQCSRATTSMSVANPAATMVVPANGSTVAGSQLLDCVPPAGYDGVQFWIEGPSLSGSQFVGAATPTYYGWLFEWNSASVAGGYYSIYCTAGSPSTGAAAFSPTILVNVGPVP